MYDSEDSDWDDPYALASAEYVEDYDFDVPEGMDLMVHHHRLDPDSLDVQQDCQMDMAPACHTSMSRGTNGIRSMMIHWRRPPMRTV